MDGPVVRTRLIQAGLIALAIFFLAAPVWAGVAVDTFTPEGQAKAVRQVSVRFTEPMVAFGDPRLPDPFTVACEGDASRLKGRGRWADTKNWIYDFEADLPAGQRCKFTLKADLKSAAGQAVEGKREFAFNTGGPAVITSLPREGEEFVDEEQVFLLALDAPLDTASINGAWCEAGGINERIPLTLLGEKEIRELLEANKDAAFNLFSVYFKGRRGPPFANFKIEDKRWRDLPVIGARCARKLPAGADMGLVLGPDVKSKTGLTRGTPQRLAFKVRPAFNVRLTCQRVNKDAACLPVTPITLSFNAPVPRDSALGMRLKSERGQSFEPVAEPNVKTVESIEFKPPFPEKMRFAVELPRNFRDDAGREPENKAAFPLSTATDENPPLIKFPGQFGILELNAEPLLPVTVRNVEPTLNGRKVEMQGADAKKPIAGRSLRMDDETQILQRYRSFLNKDSEAYAQTRRYPREGEASAIRSTEKAVAFDMPRPGGDKPMEVIGIPLPKPGFYIVELASPRLGSALHGEDKPYYVSTSVLVTNLAVHLKHGRESSLVWVTSLDRGQPVAGAHVTVRDCTGKVWFEGDTDAKGIANAKDSLPLAPDVAQCKYRRELFAFARAGDDLSFTSSAWITCCPTNDSAL